MAFEKEKNPLSLSQSQAAPPSKVSTETISKAVVALLKWIKSKTKPQNPQLLLDHHQFVYLILTLKKSPPRARYNPCLVPFPNPLHPFDSSQLCLIFLDTPKSSLTTDSVQKKIQSQGIPISKVLKFSKLKSDYGPFEAKRKLCSSYDLFLADKGVIPLLPRQLGKEFFKNKKVPIPVDLSLNNWKEQFQLACRSEILSLRTGTCSVIKVARISQSRDEIVANVLAAIDGIADIVPRKWGNIRSFHLKLTESLALPIYQTVPDMGFKIEFGVKSEEERKVGSLAEKGAGEEEGRRKNKRGRVDEVQYSDKDGAPRRAKLMVEKRKKEDQSEKRHAP